MTQQASWQEVAKQTNLTNSQFLIWMGQKLNPELPLYNMALAWTIEGSIEPQRFQAAFQALIDRCDALRMVVNEVRDVPLLKVLPHLAYEVPFVDLSGHDEPAAAYQAWQDQHVGYRFDLAERLFDSALFKLSDDSFVWYLNQHHLITDGVAVALLFKAMAKLYGSASEGTPADTPVLPTYRDYIVYERDHRSSVLFQKATEYWREKLADPLEPTQFYGRSPVPGSARTERVVCELGVERSRKIRALAMQPGIRSLTQDLTLFNIFAALLFTYLHRIGGQRQMRIGAPFHNRPTPSFQETVGLFIEICPLQIEIGSEERYTTLISKVGREMQFALRYAQAGVSSAVTNRSYNVLLNYVNASFSDFSGLPTRSEWVHAGYGDSNHQLRLQVHDLDASNAFLLHFDVNCDIFDEGIRGRMVDHFLQIVDAFLAEPSQALEQVSLLSAEEEKRLVHMFNWTAAPLPPGQTVTQLFERQVDITPDSVAVVDGTHRLTYRELNERANQLARYLRRQGVSAKTMVGLCTKRSAETLIGLLGILKAGGAYVPLDPNYPRERLAFMLAEIQAPVILTQTDYRSSLPASESQFIFLDGDWAQIARFDADNLLPLSTPDSLVYVIFTSGSTGKPKGVMIPHSALLNYVQWARQHYCGNKALTFPFFSSLSFDLTVTSIFVPLVSGGTIVVYREEEEAEPAILRVFRDDAVDIVKLTPAHLALLGHIEDVPGRLRKLIVGGEDFKTHLARTVHERFGGAIELYNEYGPTEATVGCMVHRYDPAGDMLPSVPIGVPVANAQIYVLDQYRQPTPIGVVGEIYIGGAGVARGYLNRSELTADRFLPDPFQPQQRLYRTGDLAQWRPDGQLTFLGRTDHQVKIRGYRIELGEVETNLLEHPAIRACVVTTVQPVADGIGPDEQAHLSYCCRCGLPSNYPDAGFDDEGVCTICRAYETYQEYVKRYFGDMDELRTIAAEMRTVRRGKYDCLVLLSGGKDSTYMLYQIVALGLHPLVFTLDNGYISEQSKANILRVVDHLSLDHVFGSTPHMDAIFVDSLQRFSNVCDGCFKTIYTLSINLAREQGIQYIVTGLSRGQLFETRLSDLYEQKLFSRDEIDNAVLAARKAYHRMEDAVSRCLDVQIFKDEHLFEEIQFVDFYRYCNVELDEMLVYLAEHAPWIRPDDTGRSTNCLINDVGIYIHKKERGFHNYALPYSWDVRLGHKQRAETLAELDDEIDVGRVHQILDEIGYRERPDRLIPQDKRLVAYYVADQEMPARELRTYLAAKLPEYMVPSYFVGLEQMPLTQNGKVDRSALPDPRENRASADGNFAAPRSENEEILAQIWAEIFHMDRISIHDNFFDLGGDSIISIQIVTRADQAGLHLLPKQIFEHETVAELAAVAERRPTMVAEQGTVSGPLPLTPIQRWFFAQNHAQPNHLTQAVLLETPTDLEPDLLEQALVHLAVQHDALRLHFTRDGDGWRQSISPSIRSLPLNRVDLAEIPDEEQRDAVGVEMAECQASLDIEQGVLMRVVLFERGAGRPHWLLLVIHHLAVDGVSWYPLLEDLETAYSQLGRGQPVELPPKTTSYKQWAELLTEYARSDALLAELDYWLALADLDKVALPIDMAAPETNSAGERNLRAVVATVRKTLDAETTNDLLHRVPAAYRTQINDLVLTALARAMAKWTGSRNLLVDVEGHGRQEIARGIKLSRTVGWFTSIAPLGLRLPNSEDLGEQITAIKEQVRALPDHGMGYGVLRYLCPDPAVAQRMEALPQAEILFNYLGQFDHVTAHLSTFKLIHELVGSYGLQNRRSHRLEISAYVMNGELQVEFTYDVHVHRPGTIESLAASFLAEVRHLIDHCTKSGSAGYTPSDFPLTDIDQKQLDRLAALLDQME